MSIGVLSIALFACGGDYDLNFDSDDPVVGLDSPAEDSPDEPPPPEECNGVDDDGDLVVDEGYDDLDEDGIADCVDADCEVELAAATEGQCAAGAETVADPWIAALEWQWTPDVGGSGEIGALSAPLVAQLTDDDGSGTIDDADDLDLVVLVKDSADSFVAVLDAATGDLHWTAGGLYYGGLSTVADVDGDGDANILAWDTYNRLVAFAPDGSVLWSTDTLTAYAGGSPQTTVADLDGDGSVEVVAETVILDGVTGELQGELLAPYTVLAAPAVVADLDRDGEQEIVYGGGLYSADGTQRWGPLSTTETHGWPIVAELDGDDDAEVLIVGDGRFVVRDTGGATLVDVDIGAAKVGGPCVADFDADGAAEVAVPQKTELRLFELDGTEVWSAPIDDSSGAASCSAFDINGDGAAEVLFADEVAFAVFEGCSGTMMFEYEQHGSPTQVEYPTVVDVDRDGHAEILLPSADTTGWYGVTAIEHDGDGWPAAPTCWAHHDFAVNRLGPEGDLLDPGLWWQIEPSLRAVATVLSPEVDVGLVEGASCASGCTENALVKVAVQLANHGTDPLATAVDVSLFTAGGMEVATAAVSPGLLPGHTTESLVLTASWTDAAEGLFVRLEPPPGDAKPDNDEVGVALPECP